MLKPMFFFVEVSLIKWVLINVTKVRELLLLLFLDYSEVNPLSNIPYGDTG